MGAEIIAVFVDLREMPEVAAGARILDLCCEDLPCGAGHWNSPIVADGRIALPEGNANSHRTDGILDIWRK